MGGPSIPQGKRLQSDTITLIRDEPKGLVAGDVFDLIVDLLDRSILDVAEVQIKLLVWEDRRQQLGRPSDFTNFEETLKKRQRKPWSG